MDYIKILEKCLKKAKIVLKKSYSILKALIMYILGTIKYKKMWSMYADLEKWWHATTAPNKREFPPSWNVPQCLFTVNHSILYHKA